MKPSKIGSDACRVSRFRVSDIVADWASTVLPIMSAAPSNEEKPFMSAASWSPRPMALNFSPVTPCARRAAIAIGVVRSCAPEVSACWMSSGALMSPRCPWSPKPAVSVSRVSCRT